MKEKDLYPPLKAYLEGQQYEVKGEINDCDIVAVRKQEPPIIIELKLSLNLAVILQAVNRLALSDNVYIGVPHSCSILKKQQKQVVKLCRMLGLGLIVINPNSHSNGVNVLTDPCTYKPRKSAGRQQRLLAEFAQRVGDPNAGGSEKRGGIMTAYRQRAIRIGEYLKEKGALKAATVAAVLEEPKAREIMYRNVYGWFEPKGKGIYTLSPRGIRELPAWSPSEAKTYE